MSKRLKSLTEAKEIQGDLRDQTIKLKQTLHLKAKGIFLENVGENFQEKKNLSPVKRLQIRIEQLSNKSSPEPKRHKEMKNKLWAKS